MCQKNVYVPFPAPSQGFYLDQGVLNLKGTVHEHWTGHRCGGSRESVDLLEIWEIQTGA